MIKVREKMQLNDGRYAALGASGNDTVVIVEDDNLANYHYSENSGKSFWLTDDVTPERMSELKVDQHARGHAYFKRVADVEFCGQSPAQRQCTELKRHLVALGYLEASKAKPQGVTLSNTICADMGPFAHEDIDGFKTWFERNHDATITWSRNLGDSQQSVFEVTCPGYGTFTGAGENKRIAKICAVNTASRATGYTPV